MRRGIRRLAFVAGKKVTESSHWAKRSTTRRWPTRSGPERAPWPVAHLAAGRSRLVGDRDAGRTRADHRRPAGPDRARSAPSPRPATASTPDCSSVTCCTARPRPPPSRTSAARRAGPRRCAAYSDSINDLPMLRLVGRPVAVNPDSALRAEARDRGWEIRDFRTGRKAARVGVPDRSRRSAPSAGGVAAG